jgi:hypothetical protein
MKDRLLKLRKLSQELRAHPDYVFADEATRQSIDDAIKNKIAQISGSEAGAFEKQAADIYAAEEKEIAETQKQQRADTNILQRYLGDVVGGIGRIGPALGKTAALGLSVIPGETGEDAARWLMEKSRDLEGKINVLAPPPDYDFSSAGAAADTVVGNALNMLPAMAATGGTSAAMQGGRVANAAAKLAQGGRASRVLSKLIDPQTLAMVGIMSAPGVMESATGKDFIGRAELPENPAMVAALSVPHALIETAFGVTPMDAAKLFGSKSISRGLMQSVKRIRDKSGAEAAAKFFVKSVIKGGKEVGKTSFGEGSEEVMQGLIEIASREFGNKDIPEAASGFMAEIGKPETWEDLGKNFVIGATVGMAISGGQKARDAIAKRITDLESQINNPKTTPEEAQQLAEMKTQLKEQLAALRERDSALQSFVLDRITEPAPLMLPDPDTARSTTGTMSDYEAYQQAKKQPPAQTEEAFPTTPIGILNKYVELRNKPDTDPIKQAFMQMMAERGLVAPEQMQYPAGPEGDALRRLDEAEFMQSQPQIAEGTYELPMLPFNSGNKYLPDGSMVTESPAALPQITPPKAERIALKSGKPFANEKTAKAYQTKNNLQESHQVKKVDGGFVLEPVKVRQMATAPLQPNAAGIEIVDKTGRIPDYPVRKLTPRGDASRIEKKLPAPAKDATTAPEMSLATTKIVDWGTLRGRQQGKRAGGMVTGGMGDMTLQGKKEYTDYVGKLPKTEYDEVYATIGDNPFYLKMYAKARAENNSHDESLNLVVAAQNKPDSQTPANDVTPAPTAPKVTQEKPYVNLDPKSNISEPAQAEKKQWFIDADNMPVYTVKSDAVGYRGPYSKQEIKDLTEVDPTTLTEKNYGKEATLARRERAVTKSAYKVEAYQGGFRVLDPQGKQYSWHTSRQAAEDKATELNSPAPKKAEQPAGTDVRDLPAFELPEWQANDETAKRLVSSTGKVLELNMDIGRGTIEKVLPPSKSHPNGAVVVKGYDTYEGKKLIPGKRDTIAFVFLRDRIKSGKSRLLGRDGLPEEVTPAIKSTQEKRAELAADVKAGAAYQFKYNIGDKIIVRNNKGEPQSKMILDRYVQDGSARYTVYPPGKKAQVGTHIWVAEKEVRGVDKSTAEESETKQETEETKPERSKYESDIPMSAAVDAHRFTSFSPEKRGESEREAYADHLEDARKKMLDLAKTDEQKKIAEEEFERYRSGYRQRYMSILSTKSRTMSPMITGPAKFPVARNNKALDAEMNKYNELKEWQDKAMRSALKKIAPYRFAVSSDQDNAVELLQKKLDDAEKLQQFMVDMNKIVKSKKLSDSDKVAQMLATGKINEANAKKLLEEDFGGRIGFAAYQLQNNSAEIRRLKQRISDLQARKAEQTTETAFTGGKIVDSVEDNRVQIFFDAKPDADTISKLKSAAFKWAPSIGAWQRMRGPDASRRAAAIVGAEVKRPTPVSEKKVELSQPDAFSEVKTSAEITAKKGRVISRITDTKPAIDSFNKAEAPWQFNGETLSIYEKGVALTTLGRDGKYSISKFGTKVLDSEIEKARELVAKLNEKHLPKAKVEITEIETPDVRGGAMPSQLKVKPTPAPVFGGKPSAAGKLHARIISVKDGYVVGGAWVTDDTNVPSGKAKEVVKNDEASTKELFDKFKVDRSSTGKFAVPMMSRSSEQPYYFVTDGTEAIRVMASDAGVGVVPITQNNVVESKSVIFDYNLVREIQSVFGEISFAGLGADPKNPVALFKTPNGKNVVLMPLTQPPAAIQRRKESGRPLYSAEYLAAKYTAKVIKAGWRLLKSGVTRFADWAKGMLKQFGSKIGKQLRSMYADLQALNKQLGKEGMIKMGSLGRPGFQKMAVVAGRSLGMEQLRYDTGHVFFDDTDMGPTIPYPMNLEPDFSNPEMSNAAKQRSARNNRQMNARFKAQQEKAIAEARAKDPAWREFLGMNEKTYKDNETAQLVAEWQAENGNAIFSVEYLIAKYGYKYAKAGYKLLRDGVNTFVAWAKPMLKEFGSKIGKRLRSLYADLQSFNKRLGRAGKTLNPAWLLLKTAKAKRLMQQSDLVWKKDDYRNAHLEFIDPVTGIGETVATVRKNAKGQWELVDSNRAFLTLKSARTAVKSAIYEQMKQAEKKTEFYKRRMKGADAQFDAYVKQQEEKRARYEMEQEPKTTEERLQSFADRVVKTFFDRRIALKRAQDFIESKLGKKLADNENPYERFDVVDGRIQERKADFRSKYWEPLLKYLADNKISYRDFNNFTKAMHAEERNNHIWEINPNFRAQGIAGSGMTTEKADEIKSALFDKYGEDALMEAGKMFWNLNTDLLKKKVEYGLMSEEARQIIEDKYDYYTPLKRIPDKSTGFDHRATGRTSEADDNLAFVSAAIDTVFSWGEKNRVKQALARMVAFNPASELWSIRQEKIKQYFDERTGEVKLGLDRFANEENVVHAKLDGEDVAIEIHDADLLDAVKMAAETPNTALKVARWFSKLVSMTSTHFNPDFVMTNLLRDVQTAMVNASVEQKEQIAKDIVANIWNSAKTARDYLNGKDTADTAVFKEFLMEGGKTGFNEVYSVEELAKDIEKQLQEMSKKDTAWYQTKAGIQSVLDFVGKWNDIAESATRFSGYVAAKNAGMSKQKAAAFAKNLTINFNKRGTAGTLLNSLYAFANASLQGSAMTARLMWKMAKTNKGRIALGAMIGLGAAMEMLNRLISDRDDEEGVSFYEKLPDYIKDNNYVLMLSGKKYVAIPMPYGFNVLPSIGRNMAAFAMGGQGLMDSAANIFDAGANAFNPLGGGSLKDTKDALKMFTPSGARPIVDIALNRKFTGRKVKPEQPAFIPESQRYYEQTNKGLVGFFKWLNEASGGNKYERGAIDFSPADVQYLFESYTGGAGKFINRSYDTASRVLSGEEIQPENVPIIRRFYGKANDYNVSDEMRKHIQVAKIAQRAKRENNTEWLKNNKYALQINAALNTLQKETGRIEESNLSDAEKQSRIVSLQKRFNKFAREKVQKNLSKN